MEMVPCGLGSFDCDAKGVNHRTASRQQCSPELLLAFPLFPAAPRWRIPSSCLSSPSGRAELGDLITAALLPSRCVTAATRHSATAWDCWENICDSYLQTVAGQNLSAFVKQFWAGNQLREIGTNMLTEYEIQGVQLGDVAELFDGFFFLPILWWWIMSVKHFRKQKPLLHRNLPAVVTAEPRTAHVWIQSDASLEWMSFKSSIT